MSKSFSFDFSHLHSERPIAKTDPVSVCVCAVGGITGHKRVHITIYKMYRKKAHKIYWHYNRSAGACV